jgi:photosystem II stability/assembly factor-like uncharacterized protein
MRIGLSFVLLATLLIPRPLLAADDEFHGGPTEFKQIKYRSIGPYVGGRVCRAAGVPGDPLTYYAAVSSGGVWKSTDGGMHWKSIFDDQPTQSVGSLAIAPSDPNVIYVGSGEANIRGNVQPGQGIFRSTDAGKTWKHVWKQRGQIGTVIVHPTNPDIAYAAVLGHAFGPNEERGVYRTTDGGKTWQRVLFKDKDTGASDVCFDPNNPRILLAGLWQTRRSPWEMTSGGPGSGLYTSNDGGDTWTHLVLTRTGEEAAAGEKFCDGLPEGIWGKIGLAIAPSESRRIFALIEADKGGLFRSDDGGVSWTQVNSGRGLRQRAWYYSTLTVDPRNSDVLYAPQVPLLKSVDGGKHWMRVKGPHHGDHHDLWIDPKNPKRMINSNDGGVDISTNGGENWFAPPLPVCQFYHVHADNQTPYQLSGTLQDIGTARGPSNSLNNAGITLCNWHGVGGGETGFTATDPSNPAVVYAGEYGGLITRYDHRIRQAKTVSIYPFDTSGHAAADFRYRFQWTAPLQFSVHDRKVLFHASNVLFRTSDGGETWQPISPDLTRNDKTKQQWSGGPITGDNTGVEVYGTIFALAESPKQKDLLWVGSDDGRVHVTRDGGKNWADVTPKGLPEWATVIGIEASPHQPDTAYVVVDNHRQDDDHPYLWVTRDLGKTWESLTAGLDPNAYLRVLREDPLQPGLLYLGSRGGVSYSPDAGKTWTPLRLNLPAVQINDLIVKDSDLVVGTEGRSLWILDDLTPIRKGTTAFKAKDVALLDPLPAIRYRSHGVLTEGLVQGVGANPPEGAIVHYWLKQKAKGDVVLEVTDAKGKPVAKLTSKKEEEDKPEEGDYGDDKPDDTALPTTPGLQRVVWDLRYDGAEKIKRAKVDSGDPKKGPLVLPGVYTLKLTVDGKSAITTLEVKPDPRIQLLQMASKSEDDSNFKPADLEQQTATAVEVRDDISRLTRTVEQLRQVRQQLHAREELLKDQKKAEPLLTAGKELLKRLEALEEKLHNPKAKVVYDILAFKGGAQLYSQLVYLYEMIREADGKPAQGWREVYQEQKLILTKLELEWQLLVVDELTRLNEQAKKLDIPGLILPTIPEKPKK